MFNLEEILKMSEEMGINIRDGADGKHYILDDYGKQVEFSTNMLMKVDEDSSSFKMKFELSENLNFNNVKFSTDYRSTDSKNSYVSKPIDVNQYIIDAA